MKLNQTLKSGKFFKGNILYSFIEQAKLGKSSDAKLEGLTHDTNHEMSASYRNVKGRCLNMGHYSSYEDRIILTYYKKVPITDLMKMLPNRTEHSIRNRFLRLIGKKRDTFTKQSRGVKTNKNYERTIESYPEELYTMFLNYVERARRLSLEEHVKPDIASMLNTFREIHGRTS